MEVCWTRKKLKTFTICFSFFSQRKWTARWMELCPRGWWRNGRELLSDHDQRANVELLWRQMTHHVKSYVLCWNRLKWTMKSRSTFNIFKMCKKKKVFTDVEIRAEYFNWFDRKRESREKCFFFIQNSFELLFFFIIIWMNGLYSTCAVNKVKQKKRQ